MDTLKLMALAIALSAKSADDLPRLLGRVEKCRMCNDNEMATVRHWTYTLYDAIARDDAAYYSEDDDEDWR